MDHDINSEHWGSYGQLSSSVVYDKVRAEGNLRPALLSLSLPLFPPHPSFITYSVSTPVSDRNPTTGTSFTLRPPLPTTLPPRPVHSLWPAHRATTAPGQCWVSAPFARRDQSAQQTTRD